MIPKTEALTGAAQWGRTGRGRSWLRSLVAASPCLLAPLASVSIFITLAQYDGSLSLFRSAVAEHGFWTVCRRHGPQLSWKGTLAVLGWVCLQGLLYRFLPGPVRRSQYTPAGYLLSYRINGLSAWMVTHVLYGLASWMGWLDPAFIPRNWSCLVAGMNLAGFVVSAAAFVKAHVMPSHPGDRKFSGSIIYDFYMGIELNPRLGDSFDLKLFSNGRPGMIAWTFMYVSSSTSCSPFMFSVAHRTTATSPTWPTSARQSATLHRPCCSSPSCRPSTLSTSSSTSRGTCAP